MSRTADLSVEGVRWIEGRATGKSVPMKSNLLLMTLLFFFITGGSLIYVWSRIQVIQAGYEISSAMKAGRALAEENKRLRVEVATLKSYARIEKLATEELGMSKSKPDQVIIIR